MKKNKLNVLIAGISSSIVLASALIFINVNPSRIVKGENQDSWATECTLPSGYTSIADLNTSAVSGTSYTTRGTITSFEANSFFIQSRNRGIMIYSTTSLGSFSIGNVVDVTGTYTKYNGVNELTSPTATLYSETNPNPVIKSTLTESQYNAIDDTSNGLYIGLDSITIASVSNNNVTLNLGSTVINGFIPSTTIANRTAVRTALNSYLSNGTVLDFSGIVTKYESGSTSYYQIRIPYTTCMVEHGSVAPTLVTSISISPQSSTIGTADSQQFTAAVLPSDATDPSITWSCTTGGSITANGLFTASTVGNYTITATANDASSVTGTASISVTNTIIPVTSITISPSTATIDTAGTQQFTATVLPSNATSSSVTWSATGGTISNSGLFSSTTAGTFTITALSNDSSGVSGTASITVTEHVASESGTVVTNPVQNGNELGPLYNPGTSEQLSVNYLEMISSKYGDSILIDYGNFEMLIDGGETGDATNVQNALKSKCEDHQLEVLVVTHPHSDHMGAFQSGYDTFKSVSELTSIKYIVDFGCTYTTNAYTTYKTFRDSWVSNGSIYYPIYQMINNNTSGYPNIFKVTSDVTITFLNTNNYYDVTSSAPSDVNECSVCFVLSTGNYRYFLCGDAESSSEAGIVSNYSGTGLWSADTINIVKANHHGSKTSNTTSYLDLIKPDYYIFSSSIISNNRTTSGVTTAQHPYLETIQRVLNYTTNLYWTGTNGTIHSTLNFASSTMSLSFEGRTINYYYNGSIVSVEDEKASLLQNTKYYTQISA